MRRSTTLHGQHNDFTSRSRIPHIHTRTLTHIFIHSVSHPAYHPNPITDYPRTISSPHRTSYAFHIQTFEACDSKILPFDLLTYPLLCCLVFRAFKWLGSVTDHHHLALTLHNIVAVVPSLVVLPRTHTCRFQICCT